MRIMNTLQRRCEDVLQLVGQLVPTNGDQSRIIARLKDIVTFDKKLLDIDPTLMIVNAGYCKARAGKQLMQWRRSNDRSFALYFVDVDDFGAYNKAYGHQAADYVLARVARSLSRTEPAMIGRYGGEEFVRIDRDIPKGKNESTGVFKERGESLIKAISNTPAMLPYTFAKTVDKEHEYAPGKKWDNLSVSVGGVFYDKQEIQRLVEGSRGNELIGMVIDQADVAMRVAKSIFKKEGRKIFVPYVPGLEKLIAT